MVTETEPDDDESDGSERSEEERLDEFKQFVQENDLLSEINGDDKELESLTTLGKEALLADKQFRIFKKRISKEPKQVCMCSMCQEIFSPLFNLVMLWRIMEIDYREQIQLVVMVGIELGACRLQEFQNSNCIATCLRQAL